MQFTRQQCKAFFYEFSRIASCLANKTVPVRETTDGLGYTTAQTQIYLSVTDDVFDSMTPQQGFIFLRGVFAHELLHVLITDFTKYVPAIQAKPEGAEQEIFSNILNILEDGAIEYFAPEHLSDEYVRSLEFVRAKLYQNSGKIKSSDSPLQQFITAALQFRFFGFLRGRIQNRKARRIFAACVPLMGRCFEEPTQARRIQYAERIFELSKPLWERQVKANEEAAKRIQEMLDQLMRDYFSPKNNGSGHGDDTSNPESGKDSAVSKRRRITFRRISAEEYERMMEEDNGSGSGAPPDGDMEVLIPDGPVKNKPKGGAGAPMPTPDDSSTSKDTDAGSSGSYSDSPKTNEEQSSAGASGDDRDDELGKPEDDAGQQNGEQPNGAASQDGSGGGTQDVDADGDSDDADSSGPYSDSPDKKDEANATGSSGKPSSQKDTDKTDEEQSSAGTSDDDRDDGLGKSEDNVGQQNEEKTNGAASRGGSEGDTQGADADGDSDESSAESASDDGNDGKTAGDANFDAGDTSADNAEGNDSAKARDAKDTDNAQGKDGKDGDEEDDAPDREDEGAPYESDMNQNYDGDNDIDREAGDHWNTPKVTMTPEEYEGSQSAMEDEIKKELVLNEEELMAIHEVNERYEAAQKVEEKVTSDDELNLDLHVGGGFKEVCKNARCQNIIVKCPDSLQATELYRSIVGSMSGGISSLTSQLGRILRNRQEEKMYKQNGRISIKRLNCGRVTSRVFTKRKLPEATDLAIAVAIDISGSMSGSKIVVAQSAAIALAEVFGNLNIPLYVFGFTADIAGFDANHFHYINWSNRKSERLRLLGIQAHSNNFDGYSIRYAAELLKRKDADKKLLLVISDGNPAANAYRYIPGLQDVQLAVNEANRVATTIGILLGNLNPKYHRQMYGYNFIHCANVQELFPQLAKTIKRYL